jgi:hypothetical protein
MSARSRRSRRWLGVAAAPALVLAVTACQGPSTSTRPYIYPLHNGTRIKSLFTVGDGTAADNGYEMVGLPDGLGARLDPDGNVVVNMNHELRVTAGIPRLHGQRGAFVSKLVIDPVTSGVLEGSDLIQPGVTYYDYLASAFDDAAGATGTRADGKVFPAYTNEFGRLCSSSLTDPGQLFNADTGRGYAGQLYFANEENGDEGRVFAVDENGRARQLPRLGLFSRENTLAAPNISDTTLVMGTEDAATGQIWAYVGSKTSAGGPTYRAGLQNGRSNVITLADADPAPEPATDTAFRLAYDKGDAVPFTHSAVDWDQSGADQNAEAAAEGLTLNRIEDGAWDPSDPNDFYFVTTEGGEGPTSGGGGGLWKLSYTDIEQPALGGTLTLVLDGTESIALTKPDNMDIDTVGNLLLQEDPGATDVLARIVAYRISDGAMGTVAEFESRLFSPSSPGFLTNDEESSGIIDVSELMGPSTFLFDAQVHTAAGLPAGTGAGTVEEYVERGQLLLMTVSDWPQIYGSAAP